MSERPEVAALRLSLECAERRRRALEAKDAALTRAEIYELDMTLDHLKRGKAQLALLSQQATHEE